MSMPQPTYSTGLPLRVDDLDRNTNSRSQQLYTGPILVTVSNQAPNLLGGQYNPLKYNLKEQNLNSNIFVPNYPGDQIKIVPGSTSNITSSDQTSGLLKVQPGNTITISYNDTSFDNGHGTLTSTINFEITHTAATLEVNKATATQGSILTYTMTNPDLNNDPNVVESYTVRFDGGTDYNIDTTKPKVMSNWNAPLFDARIRVSGATKTLVTPFTLTFIETGPNTGVFTAQLNLQTFATAVGGGFKFTDGDNIQLSIKDVMDQSRSVFPEATATTTFGLDKPTITLDRTTLGSPRDRAVSAPDGDITVTGAFANLGPQVIHVTITDPSANTDPQRQETLIPSSQYDTDANGVLLLNQAGTSNNKLRISLLKSDGTAFAGAGSITVSKAIMETGLDTGIFTGEIQVNFNPNDTPAQWIGSKIKFEYAGQDNKFGTSDDADPVSASFTARDAILQTNSTVVATGKSITITVRDDDANRDTATAEQVSVGLRYTNNTGVTQNTSTTLDETGPNTGIFTKTLNIGTSVVGGKPLTIQPDTDFRIRYYDLTPNIPSASSWPDASSSQTQHDLTLRTAVATGGLTLTPTVVGPATQIKVTVTDSDLNTNPQTKQTAISGLVTVVSDRGAASRADLNIDETGPNTGIFEGKVRLNPSQTAGAANTQSNDVTINVLPGDIVSIRYEDQHGVNGQRTTISKTVQVVSVDPMMNFSKTSYAVGDTLMLTIDDPDANRDPDTADILTLRATSTTDPVGLTNVQAIETGPNTGVFQAIIPTSSTFSTGALQVNNGDTVTVVYEDQFPANFRQKFDQTGTLAGSSQKFSLTTTIGGGGTPNTATPTTPGLFNLDGSSVTAVTTGQQVVVGTTVKNNDSQTRTMTVFVEVRDADGITVKTDWQTTTLGANGS
ncbi:MAG: hypothetical protein C4292_01895, partial [Nitrososphaera sp.]